MNARRGNHGSGSRSGGLLLLVGAAVIFFIILSTHSSAEEICCDRNIYTPPFSFERGYSNPYGGHLAASAFDTPITQAYRSPRCPLNILMGKPDANYIFKGTIVADEITGQDAQGRLRGRFSAMVQLVDPNHGNKVLREESISWSGTQDWTGLREWYDPSTNSMNASVFNHLEMLGGKFIPFHEFLHDYERMPESCKVEMKKEKVNSGEKIEIKLRPLDFQGRQPQPWQRVVVKAPKGKILNGTRRGQSDDEFVFTAENGTIQVEYQAPEDCEETTETLSVYNSCEIFAEAIRPLEDTVPARLIVTKEFQVVPSIPESVKIEPDRDPVNAGQTVSIYLKDILDGQGNPPLPAKELYVQMEKGSLVSEGGKSKGLFIQVGDGNVKLRYQAPSECRKTTERMTIQNKCIKRTKSSEEVISRQIGEKRFEVECWKWFGSLECESISENRCQISPAKGNGWRYLDKNDVNSGLLFLNITTNDEIFPDWDTIIKKLSGTHKYVMDNRMERGQRWPSGAWTQFKSFMGGSALCAVGQENLDLNIVPYEDLFNDPMRENRSFRVNVAAVLKEPCLGPILMTELNRHYEPSKGSVVIDRDEKTTLQGPLGVGLAVSFDSRYEQKKNGQDRIYGNFSKEEETQVGPRECPPLKTTNRCNFVLERRSD